jgi:hypothetical protein
MMQMEIWMLLTRRRTLVFYIRSIRGQGSVNKNRAILSNNQGLFMIGYSQNTPCDKSFFVTDIPCYFIRRGCNEINRKNKDLLSNRWNSVCKER